MTIKIYPSALDGNPIETHEIESPISVIDWFKSNVRGFDLSSPISNSLAVSVNGKRLSIDKWLLVIEPEDDVKIIIEPKGTEAFAIASLVISIVAAVAAYVFAPSAPKNRSMQGRELGMPDLSANEVRYGDAIPEIAGSPIHYPDYLSPPRRWFVDKRTQKIEMLLCVGMGSFDYSLDNVWIGDTPAPSIYNIVDVNIYPPGASLSLEQAAQHWHSCPEVGVTSVAGAGITLKYNNPSIALNWNASAFLFSGTQVASWPTAYSLVPNGWQVGDSISIPYPTRVVFAGDYIQSTMLDAIGVVVGDIIEVGGINDGTFEVLSITPAGVGSTGTASTLTGTVTPDLDFTGDPVTIAIGRPSSTGFVQRLIFLDKEYTSIANLVSDINLQIGSDLFVCATTGGSSNALVFTEIAPFSGQTLQAWGAYSGVLGSTYNTTTGTATTDSTPAKYHVAESFIAATEVTSVGLEGFEYEITALLPSESSAKHTIAVKPFGKASFAGFPDGGIHSISISQTGRTIPTSVYGPFRATPLGAKCDAFECDIFMPRGLYYTRKNGDVKARTSNRKVLWRKVGGTLWNEVNSSTTDWTRDQIGLTIRVDLPEPMEVEVAIEAGFTWVDPRIVDEQQWIGLRSRIVGYPTSYPDFTVMAVTMSSGDAIATQAENKVKVRFTRILPKVDDAGVSEPTRDLAPFFIHAIEATGKYGRNNIDMQALQDAHDYWVANGHKFDLAITSQSTLKQVLNQITKAGFGETVASRGKITPVLDIKRNGIPMRIYSPQQYTTPLTEAITMPREDDIDGVDCEYVDFETGKTETVSFRLPSDQGLRTTTIKAIGVTDKGAALRIAARHRLTLEFRRVSYSGQTEMHMLTNQYMDFVGLQDGWYEYGQSAYIMAVSGNRIRVSEPIRDWAPDMVMLFRDSEGSVSEPVSVLSVENEYVAIVENVPVQISLGENGEEATVVYFGTLERMYYPALITAINPQENGITSFGAVKYDPRVYELDFYLEVSGKPLGMSINEAYDFTFGVRGSVVGINYTVTGLPTGIMHATLADGRLRIYGAPIDAVGYYNIVVYAQNSTGQTYTHSVSVGLGEIVSLLHFDGANNSTTFTDQVSGSTWDVGGTARLTTAWKQFGTASYIRVAGSGAPYIRRPRLPIANTEDFNVSFFYRPNQISAQNSIFDTRLELTGQPGVLISQPEIDPAKVSVSFRSTGGTAYACQWSGSFSSVNDVIFIQAIRKRNKVAICVDSSSGRSITEATLPSESTPIGINANALCYLGNNIQPSTSVWSRGNIDEFKVIRGSGDLIELPQSASDYPVV